MTNYIIMSAAQASAVSGESEVADYAALQPIKLADGVRYVLPLTVMADPAHADKWPLLAGYSVGAVADNEFAGAAQ